MRQVYVNRLEGMGVRRLPMLDRGARVLVPNGGDWVDSVKSAGMTRAGDQRARQHRPRQGERIVTWGSWASGMTSGRRKNHLVVGIDGHPRSRGLASLVLGTQLTYFSHRSGERDQRVRK